MGVKVGGSPCMGWSSTFGAPHTPSPPSSPSVHSPTRRSPSVVNATACNLVFWTDRRHHRSSSLRRNPSEILLRSTSLNGYDYDSNNILGSRPIRRSASSPFDTLFPSYEENYENDVDDDVVDEIQTPNEEDKEDDNNAKDELVILSTAKVVDASLPSWMGKSPEGTIATMVKSKTKNMLINLPTSLPNLKTLILKNKKKKKANNKQTTGERDESPDPSAMWKAFSSMVLMIRELHVYTLQLREMLMVEDMKAAVADVQSDMNASFCWLFHHIFSCTPTLMLSIMLLLANFTIHSMSPPVPLLHHHHIPQQLSSEEDLVFPNIDAPITTTSREGNGGDGGVKQRPIPGASDDGEEKTWMKIVKAAESMQAETRPDVLMKVENLVNMVAPVKVAMQPEEPLKDSRYARTHLIYQSALQEDPSNPLLLSNYAQFLFLVARDHERADQYFRRAVTALPVDGESLKQYANFLWVAKRDVFEADRAYTKAIAADPSNSSLAANYAHFLWSIDTCFPVDAA